MRVLRSYLFRTKDPCIDALRTIIQDATGDKGLANTTLKDIEDDGGPTAGTLRNWFHGDTKRPQNCTVEATGRALGMQRVWVKRKANGKTQP